MLALTGVKIVPIVASETVYSTNIFIGCRKNPFRIMLLPLVLLANIDCAIDRTGSSRVNDLRQQTFLLDSVRRSQLVWSCIKAKYGKYV